MRGQRTEDRKQRTKNRGLGTDICLLISLFCLAAFVAGCAGPNKEIIPLIDQINQLTDEKADLAKQMARTKAENEDLKKRNQVLSGLPDNVKGENLYHLQQVKITKYTNLYDKDEDGKKEKLIVYIQPIDQDGDLIKAAGDVEVELWDLNSPQANKAKLGHWKVKLGELKKLWFAAMMSTNYRLTFDISGKVKDTTEPLNVKVTFTDYLTGKVFKEQQIIKPQPE